MRNLSYENEFCTQFLFHANKSHFHKNGFTLRLKAEAQGNSEMAYCPRRFTANKNAKSFVPSRYQSSKRSKISNSAVMVKKRVPGFCCQVTKGIDTVRSGQWFRQTEHIMSS